jgi:hypothetical protein
LLTLYFLSGLQIALCADFAAKEEENAQLKTELNSTKEALRKMKIFRM